MHTGICHYCWHVPIGVRLTSRPGVRVQVPEGPGTAGPQPSLGSKAPGGGFWPADGVDLSDITEDVLGIAVPRFADGAAVFVLERHLASAAAAGASARGGSDADPDGDPGPGLG